MKQEELNILANDNYEFLISQRKAIQNMLTNNYGNIQWKAYMEFKYREVDFDELSPIKKLQLNAVMDIESLIKVAAYLIQKKKIFDESQRLVLDCSFIHQYIEFTHQGKTLEDWLYDIRLLITRLHLRKKVELINSEILEAEELLADSTKRELKLLSQHKRLQKNLDYDSQWTR